MSESHFIETYRPTWRRLERLLDEAESDHPAERLDDLPELYRRTCQHLSIAKHRGYRASVIERLNHLVERGHAQLYENRLGHWAPFLEYARAGFARDVREEWHLFALAALLFVGAYGAMFLWLQWQPEWGYHVLGPQMAQEVETMYAEPSVRPPEATDSDVKMFGFYIYNNVSIALRTFASGLLAGVGAIFLLLHNGAMIGAIAGHVQNAGFGHHLWPFIIGHGAFELTAIVLAGQAGLKIGFAPIWPGRRGRLRALREEARESVGLVAGVVVMLLLAAFVEAFWSPSTAPPSAKYAVGGVLWTAVVVYFGFAGRSDGSR